MDKLIFYLGAATFGGGVFLFLYEGIMYIMNDEWYQRTLIFLVDHGPESLIAQVEASPGLANALDSCPLFLALILLGMLLLFVGSRLGTRYSG
ncbi:MAG TPA: hypothetical protein PKM41_16400 [Deltaproteobacteria bacterium]|nr:MAG: hypothetical protein BWY93_02364 [Euryarchaeota archaeon ADurb.BinA087]HNY67010.1 hypothetical protein [Deltaproteobacteria bacterium]HOI08699.1 hypothetical protein [Deltaproteobacteria bacterium]